MRQLHKKEGSVPDDQILPIYSSSRSKGGPGAQIGKIAQAAAHLLGIAAVGGVTLWCGGFRGGLRWNDPDKDLLFNFHPVLMIAGFIFLHGEASLIYKTSAGSKNYRKLLHLLLQGLALLLGLLGVLAAIKFHNEKSIDNFYSLHSWLGIFTIAAFIFQWIVGFTTYWFPGATNSSRAAVLPWHVFAGLLIYSLTLLTAETAGVRVLGAMASAAKKLQARWMKPEVFPLIVFIGGAMGLASFMCVRNLMLNPEVRLNKEDREAGLLQNFKEGKAYHEHGFRKFLRTRKTEIMPNLNAYFSKTSSSSSSS